VLPREYTHHPVIHSAPALEGNTGTRSMLIEVYLDEPVFTQTTYPYETIAVTATEGEDYTPIHGVIVFNAGENRQYLRVPIIGDTTFEDDEIFILRVGNVESDPLVILNDDADIPDPLLGITLFDSDGLALENMSVLEADVDKNITIRLALSTPARKSGTSVHCTLAPIKNRPIVIGDTIYTEYHSMVGEFVSRDIEFAIGEQVKEVNVTILGDTINESNKSFTIRLSDAMNIRLYNTSSIILPGGTTEDTRNIDIMILDDDPLPEVGFENATYNISEGKILDAKLILSEKSYQNIEINITIGENSTATQEEDYNLSIVNIVIPATAPNATTDNVTSIIEVNTSKGLDGEGDETLILDIDSVKNASKAEDKNSTTITIQEVDTSSPIEGKAFVSMKDATHGTELWSTNGTAVGTGLFIDLATDANSSNPRLMTRVGSLLYFVATDDSYHEKLFVTDGTASGTVELASFFDAYLSDMITVDGKLYFAAANSVTNVVELWKSEGTNSTTAKLIDIYNGYEWMSGQMVVLGEHIYFPSNVSSEEYDIELYTYDTVSNILSLVKDIKEGTEGSNIMRLTVVDDLLYFMANSNEVWKSNGTEANTVLVHTDLAGAYITRLSYLNDMIYFSVNSSSGSMVKSLSKSSDTVSEIATYTEDNIGILTVTTDRVYYTTSPNTSGGEYRLYSISGTTSASVGLLSSYASKTRSLGSYLYVQQSDGLYSSDGTSIVNVKPLASGESIDFAVESLVDELLFHVKNYSAGTVSLWKTNGSAVGTVKLAP
jgi:ELWxxDGT repeat protein